MSLKKSATVSVNCKTKFDKAKLYKYKNGKAVSSKGLTVNMKGFLCSCNNREKECVRESYNILNKYSDELYGTEQIEFGSTEKTSDIQDELVKEIEFLRQQKKGGKHRFQSLNTGARNLVFISTTLEKPTELAYKIITDIYNNKKHQARYLLRLIPIEATCKAHLKNIEKTFEPLIQQHFKDEPKSFSVIFNHRMNDSLSKDDTIKLIADKIMASRSDHKVNLKEADVSVVVEVIKSIALIGILPGYTKYKKYNLLSLCSDDKGSKETTVDSNS